MCFLEELQQENKKLFDYTLHKINSVKPVLDQIDTIFREYTDHSSTHSNKVLELGYKLNSCKLNVYEKCIFILSSFFHDIGMNVSQSSMDLFLRKIGDDVNYDFYLGEIANREKLRTKSEEEKKVYIALDHFRNIHGKLSSDYILKNFPKNDSSSWFNTIYLWEAVSLVCQAHTLDISEIKSNKNYCIDYLIENDEKINILYLSLLLRLSDICHFSRDRALPYCFQTKAFISGKSENIWEYYSDVVTTFPDSKTNTIRIQARCDNFFNHRAIVDNAKRIQKELFNCHQLLNHFNSPYLFEWKLVDKTKVNRSQKANYRYYDTRFRLNHKKITDLVMGEKLYSDKLYAIRECIQNSIDAIKVIKTKIPEGNYIYIDYHNKSEPILDIYDTGTGMNIDIVHNNFLSVGSKSYWHTEKCIKEWELNNAKTRLIADHGIGALSYFMIAEKIAIYTKYHFSQEYIHVYIDNYDDGIIFLETPRDSFPRFCSTANIKSPWDLNHGTCIRFYLKSEHTYRQLLSFLSVNIIRNTIDMYFRYNTNEHMLSNIWHFRSKLDRYAYKKTNDYYTWYIHEEQPNNTEKDLKDSDLFGSLYNETVSNAQ